MADQFVAEIRIVPFNFAPTGWAICAGQLMPISQNTALFSLLGTQYGGDGKSTFGLPNLQGMVPMHQGQGPGLSQRFIGEVGGQEAVSLISSELPQHTHAVGTGGTATSTLVGRPSTSTRQVYGKGTLQPMDFTNPAGGGAPHNNMQPYLVMNYVIALQGIFPSRA